MPDLMTYLLSDHQHKYDGAMREFSRMMYQTLARAYAEGAARIAIGLDAITFELANGDLLTERSFVYPLDPFAHLDHRLHETFIAALETMIQRDSRVAALVQLEATLEDKSVYIITGSGA